MRIFKVFLSVAIVIWIGFSCQEPKLPVAKMELPAGNCNITRVTELERTYSFEYDSSGFLVKIFWILAGFDPIIEYKLEYHGGKLTTIHSVSLEGVSYPETKFEYNGDLLHRIRKFDGYRQSVADTVFQIKERERTEFGYTVSDKPASLIRWFPDGKGGFSKSHESKFEYNAAGNLAVERRHGSEIPTAPGIDYVLEYFYDDKPNSQKQLNYLFFSASDSPTRLYSINNINRVRITFDDATFRDREFKLVYNSRDNIVTDNYRFKDITWNCE